MIVGSNFVFWKIEVTKDVVQNVLYTLGQLSLEFPEVSDLLTSRITDAGLRIPNKPPTTAGGGGRGRTTGSADAGATARGQSYVPEPAMESVDAAPLEPRTFELPLE